MKYKKFPTVGAENLDIEDLEFMQNSFQEAINGLLSVLGAGNYILSGVVDNDTEVSGGWIYYNGELLEFKQGNTNANFIIIDNSTAAYGDCEKYATPSDGIGSIPLSGLIRAENLGDIARKIEGSKKTIDDEGTYNLNDYTSYVAVSSQSSNYDNDVIINLPDAAKNKGVEVFVAVSDGANFFTVEIKYNGTTLIHGFNASGKVGKIQIKNLAGEWVLISSTDFTIQ